MVDIKKDAISWMTQQIKDDPFVTSKQLREGFSCERGATVLVPKGVDLDLTVAPVIDEFLLSQGHDISFTIAVNSAFDDGNLPDQISSKLSTLLGGQAVDQADLVFSEALRQIRRDSKRSS